MSTRTSEHVRRSEVEVTMRIMAVRDGERKPLYDSDLEGDFSPSPSLRIERHTVEPSMWQRITIPRQVLTLSLGTHEVQYNSPATGSCQVTRTRGAVMLERRDYEQHVRWNSPAVMLSVELADAVLEDLYLCSAQEQSSGCTEETRNVHLSPLMYMLEAEREHGYPHGQLFLDGLEQAIGSIVVTMTGKKRAGPKDNEPGLAPYQMKRVNEYVQSHLSDRITLAEMAHRVGLSASHFSRLFGKTSGTTPHQFVLKCRIEHAKSMLTIPHHSLLDIALASGFRTHQHFSRIFHRVTGVSPRVYRSCL